MYGQYGNFDGYVPNQAMGVYNTYNQFDLDPNIMMSLGFTQPEIQTLQFIVMNGGKVTPMALSQYGMDYESAQRIKYMYDIATGRVSIESPDDLVKHLRKMFGKHRRIGINDLALSKISRVPRLAVIGGIPKGLYQCYNSKNYPLNERMYEVVDVSGSRITIETKRKPVLPYGCEKKLYYIKDLETGKVSFAESSSQINSDTKSDPKYKIGTALEIKDLTPDKKVLLSVDKDYARICNRFIIVGSLRHPEWHHGMIEIICLEGTKVYVYATTMGKGENVTYKGGTQRVYDYGYIPNEIQPKLVKAATDLYKMLCGVMATNIPPNSDFKILDPEQPTEEETIEDSLEL